MACIFVLSLLGHEPSSEFGYQTARPISIFGVLPIEQVQFTALYFSISGVELFQFRGTWNTLWQSNMAMENPLSMEVLIGKSPINGLFSTAMFGYQKVFMNLPSG